MQDFHLVWVISFYVLSSLAAKVMLFFDITMFFLLFNTSLTNMLTGIK